MPVRTTPSAARPVDLGRGGHRARRPRGGAARRAAPRRGRSRPAPPARRSGCGCRRARCSTWPGSTASPSRASRTGMALRASSRSARERVKPRGMCCTTRIAAVEAGGQAGDQGLQGGRPAGRGGDHDALGRRGRGASGAHSRRGAGRASTRALPSARIFATSSSARLSMLMGCDGRLVHEVHGPELEPAQRDLGALLGERGQQQHRHRLLGHEALEGLQAAEPRHLDVEGHDVGPQLASLREALLAVDGEAHHLDVVRRRPACARRPCARTRSRPRPGHGSVSSGSWARLLRASGRRWRPGSGSG